MRLITATPEGGTSAFMVALAVDLDGRVHLSPRAPLEKSGTSGWHVDGVEFRAALEAEWEEHGPKPPAALKVNYGRRVA